MRPALRFVILDLDEVIFPHWQGLGVDIYDTMAAVVAEKLAEKNISLSRQEIDDLILRSYNQNGLGTVLPSQLYGIDHGDLHREYHRRLLDNHVLPQFEEKTAPIRGFYSAMRQHMTVATNCGVKFGVLTHGDEQWADIMPQKAGIADLAPFRRGIDSFQFRMKHRDRSLLHDFLRAAGFRGAYENVMLVDDRLDNLERAQEMGIRVRHVDASKGEQALNTLRVLKDIALEARERQPLCRLTA